MKKSTTRPLVLEPIFSYLQRGWRIFPLHSLNAGGQCSCNSPDCTSIAKHPLTKRGCKDATLDRATVEQWSKDFPSANWGIATGAASSLVVVDVDPRHGGEESLGTLQAKYGLLPETLVAQTGGGGLHFFFRHPKRQVKNSMGKLGQGLDVRGDGGYVVCAPSIHASGQLYEWANDYKIADLPEWLLDLILARDDKPKPAIRNNIASLTDGLGAYESAALQGEINRVRNAANGQRNDSLNHAAFALGQLVGGGVLSESLVINELQTAAYDIGLGKDEVRKTITSGIKAGKSQPRTRPEAQPRDRAAQAEAGSVTETDTQEKDDALYFQKPDGLYWRKKTAEGGTVEVRLTNFRAEIVSDTLEDSGEGETSRVFEIKATLFDGQKVSERISAEKYTKLDWHLKILGAKATVYPGRSGHLLPAISEISKPDARRVYVHTGWREIDGEWLYLHAGGGIGAKGNKPIEVRLDPPLLPALLPEPPSPTEWQQCLSDFLDIRFYSAREMTVPLIGAAIAPIIGRTNFSTHLSGTSGDGKSSFAKLLQSAYGAGFVNQFPADWSSTANYLESLAYSAKDMTIVIDEFVPTGTSVNRAKLMERADRVFRAQANHASRGRMQADRKLEYGKYPRGHILSTGEEIPEGYSVGARLARIGSSPTEATPKEWSEFLRKARQSVYAKALSGFIQWLAPNIATIRQNADEEIDELAAQIDSRGQHRRTPRMTAQLGRAWKYLLAACVEAQAMKQREADELWAYVWKILTSLGDDQARMDASQDPIVIFKETLTSLFLSGKAHLAADIGGKPQNSQSYGWSKDLPLGQKIGWFAGDEGLILLEPRAAYTALQDALRYSGGFAWSERTLWQRLKQRGMLVTEPARETNKLRRTVEGVRTELIAFHESDFVGTGYMNKPDQPDQPDQ